MKYLQFMFLGFFINVKFVYSLKEGTQDDAFEVQCSVCRDISKAFDQGLSNTSRKTYPGGNYQWEHGNLKPYHLSETRLIEVLEGICQTTPNSKKCYKILGEYDDVITEWWLSGKMKNETLEDLICIKTMQVCCPYNTYGLNCTECNNTLNEKNLPCNGHGKCKGNGTRGGTGDCECDFSFIGENCESCQDLYYYNPITTYCEECHSSCNKSCSAGNASDCEICRHGWEKDENGTCTDLQECISGIHECKENTYCENLPGAYKCKDCDPSCDGCVGPNDSNCTVCHSGYELVNGSCSDIDECELGNISCAKGQFCLNTLGNYTCEECHSACISGCNSSGSEGCDACAAGYQMNPKSKHGCLDIDECETNKYTCDNGKYCINSVGSFLCENCDSKCGKSCVGPSVSDCKDCVKGYQIDSGAKGGCIDMDECANESHTCPDGTYCLNTVGAYKCKKCHKSCELCYSTGSRSCIKCSGGYEKRGDKCKIVSDDKKDGDENRKHDGDINKKQEGEKHESHYEEKHKHDKKKKNNKKQKDDL